jgi:tetratricopeptide (TPR) repeat protein
MWLLIQIFGQRARIFGTSGSGQPTRVVLLLLVLLGHSATAEAQTYYEVRGVVYGPNAKPVANVLVSLENQQRARIGQVITNSDGNYVFSGIIAGVYYISVKPDERFHAIYQQIELINTFNSSVGGNNFSTERIDFTLKATERKEGLFSGGTVFLQEVPPQAERDYLDGLKSLKKGDKDQAIERFRKAINLFPNYFYALQQLGLVYVDTGMYQEALEPLKKAIKINAKGADAHLGLGIALVSLDQLKEAIDELNLARAIDARSFRTHLYLGMALIGTGEFDQAEESLKQALALGGPVQARTAHLYLASIYDKRNQPKLAIAELEAYLRENPKANNAPKIKEAIQKLKGKL